MCVYITLVSIGNLDGPTFGDIMSCLFPEGVHVCGDVIAGQEKMNPCSE